MTTDEVQKLSDEELRFAVLELSGWKYCKPTGTGFEDSGTFDWTPAGISPLTGKLCPLPKLDLNAMHEAESTLQHFGYYVDKLAEVMKVKRGSISLVGATARQRAEAFVLVMK